MTNTAFNLTKGGFYHVYRFMEKELGLKGNELRVYAILFSYTGGEVGMYFGSRKYLAETLSISVRTLYRILDSLFKRELIENVWCKEKGRSGIRCTPLNSHIGNFGNETEPAEEEDFEQDERINEIVENARRQLGWI